MDDLERRALLLTAVGGTLLSMTGAGPSQAQVGAKAIDVAPNKLEPKVFSAPLSTSPAKEIELWASIKQQVVDTGVWLTSFDPSYEEGVVDDLTKVAAEEAQRLTHNPRLVEPLLGEISVLLDRCLDYRKEASELELAGIAAGAARVTADSLREVDREIASIDIQSLISPILAQNYPVASAHFEKASDANLGLGNAKQASAQALVSEKIQAASEERTRLLLGRLHFTQKVERELLGRHDVPGNAHNFGERFERLRTLFESDIISAYRRAIAGKAGLKAVFDYDAPLPALAPNNFLDELVIWTRNAMRAVARVGESELEFIKQVSVGPITEAVAPATMTINLDGLKAVRLRAVGAAYCMSGGDTKNDNNGNASIGISLVKSESKLGPRVVVPLSSVRQYNPQREPLLVDGGLLYNVDPNGTWSLRVNAKGIAGSGAVWGRAAQITQIVVYLKVVGVPNPDLDGTWWITEDRA